MPLREHIITPAAYGILGRKGVPGAFAKARKMMEGEPTPDRAKWSSDNWHLIQAANNALVFGDYGLAYSWLENAQTIGIREGGPLYFPAGDIMPWVSIIWAADRDKEYKLMRQGTEFLSWIYRLLSPMTIPRPNKITVWVPNGKKSFEPNTRGGNHVFFPGPRAIFKNPDTNGGGWYAENPATLMMQFWNDDRGRLLPDRYARYSPGEGGTWDAGPWMIATAMNWIPARLSPQPTRLKKAFATSRLGTPAAHVTMPFRLRYGMGVVRMENGSLLVTASHSTAGPKPPVTWSAYDAVRNEIVLAVPDGMGGFRAEDRTGKGRIVVDGDYVFAEGTTDDGVRMISDPYFVTKVASDLRRKPRKAGRWIEGPLHPQESEPPPEEEEEKPDNDDRDWYDYPGIWLTKLWRWLEDRL